MGGAWVNMATGVSPLSASTPSSHCSCSWSMCTSCTLRGVHQCGYCHHVQIIILFGLALQRSDTCTYLHKARRRDCASRQVVKPGCMRNSFAGLASGCCFIEVECVICWVCNCKGKHR